MGNAITALKNWNSDSQWWHWTYFVDWGLCIIPIVIWASLKYTSPRCREFDPLDPSINHTYAVDETFPNWSLPLVGAALPAVLGIAWVSIPMLSGKVSWRHDVHSVVLTVAQAALLAMCLTDAMKNFAGRLRPDFLDRVRRELGFDPRNATAAQLAEICSTSNHVVRDGMKSFPSGHASIGISGWVVLASLIMTRVPLHSKQSVGFWRVILVCFCFIFPAIMSISRTTDYRHNFSDITAGTLIGVFAGMIVFKQHYASGSSQPINRKTGMCDPYSEDGTALTQVKRDEATMRSRSNVEPHMGEV